MRPVLFRLMPKTDLKQGILSVCEKEKIETGVIVSAVGSLTQAVLRIADGKTVITQTGPFELTSLSGTLTHGSAHLHASLYDAAMVSLGGHVMEGCLIHTTMEIAILDLDDEVKTDRVHDPKTGYDELVVLPQRMKTL